MVGKMNAFDTKAESTEALAESLIQVMGGRAAFEACMNSQWFDVAEQIYRISLKEPAGAE